MKFINLTSYCINTILFSILATYFVTDLLILNSWTVTMFGKQVKQNSREIL
jgi:hypothetical protein